MVSWLKNAALPPIVPKSIFFQKSAEAKLALAASIKPMAAVKRISMQVLGWVLLCIGLAGLFLPLLPGIPLALAGLFILSRQYAWAHRLTEKIARRFPKLARRPEPAAE